MKDGLNWYLYVGANPATFVDPWGLFQLPYSPVRDVPQSYRESPPTQSNNPTGNTGAAAATVVGGTAVAPKPVVNPAITQAAKQAVTSVARAVAAHPVAALIAVGGAIGVVAYDPDNPYQSLYSPLGYFEAIACQLGDIAGEYGNLQCVEAANAMKEHLEKNRQKGAIITLTFPGARDGLVVCCSYDGGRTAISYTGMHTGILYKGLVCDNLRIIGMPEKLWILDFGTFIPIPPIVKRIPF